MYSEIFNNNFLIQIGNNQSENDELVKKSNQNSLWFHLKDMPSPHGILTSLNSEKISKSAILKTASLVKEYSKANNLRRISVQYIELKYVKLTNIKGKVILMKSCEQIII
jgi:predicted ribosome quality control (RQC) complex YloA/Tae2 family protein